ncbi:MAG: family 43 glycosylhydrolase [Clostridia bacterium]|nr:family 43 glycosylhydrolase [Clostridia bacterium]
MNFAHNPILAPDIFIPDVEAHVWEDGRMYLYGSFDIQGRLSFCSDVHHVYSSDDMIHWTDHGVVFSLADSTWAKDCGALYAPDCAYRDGWYYLYYCVPDGRNGVAKSQSPTGPFVDVGLLEGVWGIDPGVLIDDDGQAYLYWGQLTWGKVAKLKENMVEIEPESIVECPLTVAEHEFHEGSSVKKINGKYYYLFADTHRHGDPDRPDGRPSCLGYAVSDHPMHGFTYGGVIIDNFGCDPGVWNNHGSMVCFKDQWYVFYHRSTHGADYSRHVCAEPIYFDENGMIPEVKQTTQGVGAPIKASTLLPANLACELSGNVRIEGDENSAHVLALTKVHNGDTATYRYLDFDGENAFEIKLCANANCRVELYLDGKYHADFKVAASDAYATARASIAPVFGTHALTIKVFGRFTEVKIDEFSFSKEEKA